MSSGTRASPPWDCSLLSPSKSLLTLSPVPRGWSLLPWGVTAQQPLFLRHLVPSLLCNTVLQSPWSPGSQGCQGTFSVLHTAVAGKLSTHKAFPGWFHSWKQSGNSLKATYAGILKVMALFRLLSYQWTEKSSHIQSHCYLLPWQERTSRLSGSVMRGKTKEKLHQEWIWLQSTSVKCCQSLLTLQEYHQLCNIIIQKWQRKYLTAADLPVTCGLKPGARQAVLSQPQHSHFAKLSSLLLSSP